MATMLPSRNSNLNAFSATTITLNSTMVSLGASTNSVYTRLSQGNFASSVSTSSWVSSLTSRLSTTTVAMSANAQYQLALSQSSISTSVLYTSTLGLSPSSWSTLSGASGLPNFSTVSYTAGAISGDGRYGLLGTSAGNLYTTSTYGSSWSNTASTVPYSYFRFDNSLADVQGNTTLTATGTIGYVSGNVGTHALSISNTPAGGGSTNYVRGPITIGNRCTIACWINFVTLPTTNGQYSQIIAFGTSSQNLLTINYYYGAEFTGLYVQYNNSSNNLNSILSRYTVTTNTWYNIRVVFQGNSTTFVYINNALVATATTTNMPTPITQVTLGGDNPISATGGGFNGYIDDLRIYNTAMYVDGTINWSSTAISNSGQYMLATVTNGGLFMSSNFGATWSQVTGAMLSAIWSNAQVSATGQYMLVNAQPQIVQPQLTGLTGSTTVVNAVTTWQVNGITWTCSASSSSGAMQNPYMLFNNTLFDNYWVSASTYNVSTGVYNGTQSTIVNGQGTVVGEYVQLQSSVPIQFQSYTFASGSYLQYPNTFTFAGSNDGINWYLLQSVTMSGNPVGTAAGSTSTSYIIINQSGTQTMTTNVTSVTFTCTTSQYSANLYTYIRFIIPSVFGTSGFTALTEVYFRFNAGCQTYSTNYGSTWSSGLPLYTIIQPQLSGISTTTWQTNGNTWISSASTSQGGTTASYLAFNNTLGGNNTWASAGTYTASTGVYTGSVSTSNIVGSVPATYTGEWLQIQSSTPIVMYSYLFANGGNTNGNQAPRIYQIVGSNDSTIWYTLQTVTVTGNPYTNPNTYANTIIVNSPGTFAGSNGSSYAVTTTTFTTGAYLYFRLCVNATIPGSFGAAELGEWVINFVGGTLSTQALSESGQYQLTANATASPILLGQLNFENSYIDTAPTPSLTYVANQGFNSGGNISLSNVQAKVGSNSLYSANIAGATTNLSYANYTLSSFFNGATAYTISTWLYPAALPASSFALPYHLTNSTFVVAAYPYIRGDGKVAIAFYTTTSGEVALDITTTATISINTWTHLVIMFASGIASIYMNGALCATGAYTGTICLRNNGGAPTNLIVGAATNAYGGYNGFIDDVRIYNAGLTSTQIYTLYATTALTPAIYITQNFSTGVPLIPTITPALNTLTNVPVASAISNTGQYMLFITNNTTGNNVYYSMNYGATFTGLQLGTATLTSCAMSYDGSYMTIASGATVYTLNNNSTGFSLALGNQAGAQNQANNAIAIGNYAGYQNQAANSIILNASGSAVNSFAPGFYVAPIASYTASSSQTFALLGYGTDSQVVQIGNVSMTSNILTLNSGLSLTGTVYGATTASAAFWMQANGNTSLFITDSQNSATMGTITMGRYFGVGGNIFQDFTGSFIWRTSNLSNTAVNTAMTLSSTGVLTVANVSIFGNSSQSLINIGANSNCSSGGSAGNNMSIGINVGRTAGTGSNNLLYGMVVGQNMTTAYTNMLFGLSSGNQLTTGFRNIIFGIDSFNAATSASYNTCFGNLTGNSITGGNTNTFIGYNVGNLTTIGSNNVAIGADIATHTTGSGNVSIGGGGTNFALTTGSYNVCVGINAGFSLTTGQYNTYIGTNAGYGSAGNVINEIVINASSAAVAGKGNDTCLIRVAQNGFYLSGYTAGSSIGITSSGNITSTSDSRTKNSIQYLTKDGNMDIIMRLKPASYKLNADTYKDKWVGFIAQDLLEVIPNCVDGKKYPYQYKTDATGKPLFDEEGNIIYIKDENGELKPRYLSVDFNEIWTRTVLAVQEQQQQIVNQQTQIDTLIQRLAAANIA